MAPILKIRSPGAEDREGAAAQLALPTSPTPATSHCQSQSHANSNLPASIPLDGFILSIPLCLPTTGAKGQARKGSAARRPEAAQVDLSLTDPIHNSENPLQHKCDLLLSFATFGNRPQL
jgi:hypothetical protein